MAWIDEDENLTQGRYHGESVEEVAVEDPDYLRWMLEEAALTTEERAIVAKHLDEVGEDDDDFYGFGETD
jgi:hypothetical protein